MAREKFHRTKQTTTVSNPTTGKPITIKKP